MYPDANLEVAHVEVNLDGSGRRNINVGMFMWVGDSEARSALPKFTDLPPDAQEVLKAWVLA